MNQNLKIPNSRLRATIIGGSGYIGSHLMHRLKSMGVEVIAPQHGEEVQLLGTDIGELFYCAGMTANFAANPVDTVQAHINLLTSLLSHCKYNSVVYLSSTRLYDRPMSMIDIDQTISEDDFLMLNPKNPRHLYDLTKAAGENLSLCIASNKASIARLACVWDNSQNSNGFMPSLIRKLRGLSARSPQTESLNINSFSHVNRHYIHINDLIYALIQMSYKEEHKQIISLSSDEAPIKNSQIFHLLEKIYNIKLITPSTDSNLISTEEKSLCPPTLNLDSYYKLIEKVHMPKPFLTDLYNHLT